LEANSSRRTPVAGTTTSTGKKTQKSNQNTNVTGKPEAAHAPKEDTSSPTSTTIDKSSSSSNVNEQQQPQKKSVAFSNESTSQVPSEGSSTPETEGGRTKKKVSAREQRSARRQAVVDEFGTIVSPPSHPTHGGKRKHNGKSSKSKRSRQDEDDANCLKIKLLTGTLYLYRGRHRRAEFVRRV
jgi:hypothetical protein